MQLQTLAGTLDVAVLAGGDSAERDVSLASGAQVVRALQARQHRAHFYDPSERSLGDLPWRQIDACLIALHGGAGEDGRIQSQLDAWGVAYTGSSAAASCLAMSKSASKTRWLAAGLATLPFQVWEGLPSGRWREEAASLGYPLVVKPDDQGSSLGLGFAQNESELPATIAAAQEFGPRVLLEPWIDGREFTVAVLGRRALPLLEIITPRGLFDYRAKYVGDETQYRFETGLPAGAVAAIESLAVEAARALGTAGLCRVDLMLDRRGRAWVLEVNTSPGLTDHSLAPKAAAQAGLSLAELCDWMLQDALQRSQKHKDP